MNVDTVSQLDILPVNEIVDRLKRLNPDGVPVYWYQRNKERFREYQRIYRANSLSRLKYEKDYKDRPEQREKHKIRRDKRRAILLNCEGHYTLSEWLNKKLIYGNKCAYCGSKVNIVKDHIISLTNGGTNNIDNIIPACRKCNAVKYNKDLLWLKTHSFRLSFVLAD